ncbi:MAG: hypothetical protein ACQEXQ_16360 [Bacillota bacterium]
MSITMQGKVKVHRNLERLKDLPGESLEKGLKYVSEVAPKRSKQRISQLGYVKTGKTMQSIHGEAKGDKAFIRGGGPGAQQIHILEYGAEPKPHLIRPKLQKSLFWGGAPHPVKLVRHPGHRIKEGRFMRGPIEDMQSSNELESIFSRAIKEMQEKLVT